MPGPLAAGFTIAAALERGDPRDAFVSTRHESTRGAARRALASARRARAASASCRHRRPDLEVVVLRGNVDTRLDKLDAGDCDAMLLAAAGLERLGLAARIRARLAPAEMLPAVGQGIVGVECAAERADVLALVRPLEHGPARTALDAERAFSAASARAAVADRGLRDARRRHGPPRRTRRSHGRQPHLRRRRDRARAATPRRSAAISPRASSRRARATSCEAPDRHRRAGDATRNTRRIIFASSSRRKAAPPCAIPRSTIRPRPDRAAVRAAVGPDRPLRPRRLRQRECRALRRGHPRGAGTTRRIAAIGQATAAALNAAGQRVSLMPEDGADSESLLALPELGT